MCSSTSCNPAVSAWPRPTAGFSLVEVVIALTIIAVLAGVAVPAYQGFREEQRAREPLTELVRLARETRLRALQDRRPYQIAFHASGFTASRHTHPYLQQQDLQQFLDLGEFPGSELAEARQTLETARSQREQPAPGVQLAPALRPMDPNWSETYSLPSNTRYTVQFWHEIQPIEVNSNMVRLWVFQPTGLADPLSLRMVRENLVLEAEFGAITSEVQRESLYRQ